MWCVAWLGLDVPARLEAVHAGHHHVEQNDVDALARQHVERLLAAIGGQHLEVLGLKPGFEQLHVGQNIIDDEDAGSHGSQILTDTGIYDFEGPMNLRTVSRKDITEIGFDI